MEEFDLLVDSFNDNAKVTESDLKEALGDISSGKVPSDELIQKINSDISALKEDYNNINELAKTLLLEDEIPVIGSSVFQYAEAVSTSRKEYKKQIDSISNTLIKFISVKSLVDKYQEELAPFQDKAKALIADITTDKNSIDNIEVYKTAGAGPIAFVKAIECEDVESEEGFETVQNVGNYFPPRVVYALGAGKYYIDQEELKRPFQSITTIDNDSKNDNSESTSVHIVETNNDLIIPDNEVKDVLWKPSSFKNTIVSMPNVVRLIVPLLTNLCAISQPQIERFLNIDCFIIETEEYKRQIGIALHELLRKGIIIRYSISSEFDDIYVLSENACNCIHKDSIYRIRNFWAISIGDNRLSYSKDKSIGRGELEAIYHSNDLLLDYLSVCKKIYTRNELKKTIESIRSYNRTYRVVSFVSNEKVHCTLYQGEDDIENNDSLLVKESYLDKISDKCDYRIIVFTDSSVFDRDIDERLSSVNNDPIELDNKGQRNTDDNLSNDVQQEDNDPSEEKLVPNSLGEVAIELGTDEEVIVVHTTHKDSVDKKDRQIQIDSFEHNYIESALENDVPAEDEFICIIDTLLNAKAADKDEVQSSVVDATLLAKCSSYISGYDTLKEKYDLLLYATDLPYDDRSYSYTTIFDIASDMGTVDECVLMSIYLRALLAPKMAYDYGLSSQAEQFLHDYDSYFPSLECVKSLFNKMNAISSVIPSGFTPAIIASLGNEVENDKFISNLKINANDLMVMPKVNTAMANLKPMYYSCFGQSSDIYSCLKIVAENNTEELEYVEAFLEDYCSKNKDELTLDEDRVEEMIRNAWYEANPGNKFDLKYVAKDRIMKHAIMRISTIKTWFEMQSNTSKGKYDVQHLKVMKAEIINECAKALKALESLNIEKINVLKWMLYHIVDYLSGDIDNLSVFSDFLKSGVFSLDDNFVPIIKPDFTAVKYYEPWRKAKEHIESPSISLEAAKSEILDDSKSKMFDNLRQLIFIEKILNEPVTSEDEKARITKADDVTERFNEQLELAYTYNQISENEKESLAQLVKQHQQDFYELRDFGCWHQFLNALKAQIQELTRSKQKSLGLLLNNTISKFDDNVPQILIDAKRLLENESESNLAVVEEYINRFAAGELEVSNDLSSILNDIDYFSDFYCGESFDSIYQECNRGRDRALRNFAKDYVRKNAPNSWATRQKEDSEHLIDSWPTKSNKDANKIADLFRCLGLDVSRAERGNSDSTYKLYVKPSPQGQADYSHPISLFGTQMNPVLDVVVLYGNHVPREIVDKVTKLDLGGMAVVILDKPMTLADRRAMCELFHTQTQRQNSFILIDQVLGIYLALHQITERIPVMLKCTLPFTIYQPFVANGSTSDEMFCGRINELRTIMDPKGASIVYGGRQLGKTALLERAEKRCHAPEKGSYAVCISVFDCNNEESFVHKIIKETNKKISRNGLEVKSANSISEMCDNIEEMLLDKRIYSFFLFIDESDDFLKSISDENYRPIQSLIDLKRKSNNNFKFVFAGLHNVCRFKKATENNGVFGQLGTPLCIKPLSPTDAIQLITKPLKYLGFQIDRFPHLETILTNTNYYPGILQFFGYTLVETLTSQYGKYYQANKENPPFPLQKEQLGSVMSSADLNASIKEKFKLSLKLDKRYLMLARCIVYRYHFENDNNRWMGYSVSQIKEVVASYPIHCLENTTNESYVILLDEMVEMGILSKQNDLYRLRRGSFIDIIGRDLDRVDAEIISDNEAIQ